MVKEDLERILRTCKESEKKIEDDEWCMVKEDFGRILSTCTEPEKKIKDKEDF